MSVERLISGHQSYIMYINIVGTERGKKEQLPCDDYNCAEYDV